MNEYDNPPVNVPTELSQQDIEAFFNKIMNGEYDVKVRPCFMCLKEFRPNYDYMTCDECFFSQFPKEQVTEFYKSFF